MKSNFISSFLLVVLSLVLVHASVILPSRSHGDLGERALPPPVKSTPKRKVVLLARVHLENQAYSKVYRDLVVEAQSSLVFEATKNDEALRLDLGTQTLANGTLNPIIRATIYPPAAGGKTPQGVPDPSSGEPDLVREFPDLTSLTNEQLMSATTGKGLFLDTWKVDRTWIRGGGVYNGCLNFMLKLLRDERMGGAEFQLPEDVRNIFISGMEYGRLEPKERREDPLTEFRYDLATSVPGQLPTRLMAWDTTDPKKPRVVFNATTKAEPSRPRGSSDPATSGRIKRRARSLNRSARRGSLPLDNE